ncbi:MAG TPA: hypothetical protein VHL57_01945 [Flavobacteriales bacterium]|jgi:uncharacterized protein (DUF3084 family)|nr:hypothetical protein [Flavobacteriales bacterium]
MKTTPQTSAARLLAVSFVAALALAACQQGPSPEEQARDKALSESAQLRNELQSRDSLIGEMALSFDEIENNIALMDESGKSIASAKDEANMDKRQRIVKDLQLMNGLLKDSRDRIAELNKRLDRSKIDASGLRKKLKELDMQLAMRDSSIATMKDELLARDFKIGQVNDQLTAIELEVAKREAIIAQQEHEINKAYIATGSYDELAQKGVLTKEGGVIGIGKRTEVRDDAGPGQFTEVDVRELRKVPVNAKSAKLITEHPKSSYQLVEENDHLAYLEIKDPEQFWKRSKYLVLETN